MQTEHTQQLVAKRYELHEKLGQGGMGAVYKALDRLTGQIVALKQVTALIDNPTMDTQQNTVDFRVSLAREFKVLASLRHPNIISVLDYGFDEDNHPFVTMELLVNSREFVEAAEDQPFSTQVNLLSQVLQALAYLHRRNILHRDLKPGNVAVVIGNQVKVLDFGLAVEPGQAMEIAGTIAYMAPEVMLEDEPTPAADLYSFGVIAYEVFAGEHPFPSDNPGELVVRVVTEPVDLSRVQPRVDEVLEQEAERTRAENALRTILGRLLAKTPQERYSDAYTVLQELNAALGLQAPRESAAIRESFLQAATFVGRETEMQQLESALASIRSDDPSGSAWLIGGESGVGKTRLIEEVKIRAMVQGVLVLRGQAVSEGGLPYQVWREPLRRLLLSTDVDDLDASILKDIIPDIEQLLKRSVPEAVDVDDADYKQRLIGTIVSVFQRQRQPILLLLEDLQWTAESLDVLRVLMGLVWSLPLLIVGNYRAEERPGLADELPGIQHMRLERLNQESIAALSVSMLGEGGRDSEVLSLLQRETEGNVFFLVEIVRALAETAGSLDMVGRMTLPPNIFAGGIRSIVQRRLSHIPADGRRLLHLVAVAGRELDLDLVRQAVLAGYTLPIDTEEGLQNWLVTCNSSGVLEVVEDRWRFTHDKLRDAALEDMDEAERISHHRAIAESLEALHENPREHLSLLVFHWRGAQDKAKELHYTIQAGEVALHTSSFGDALAYFERALRLLEEIDPYNTRQQADILIQLGEALENLGDYEAATLRLGRGLELAQDDNEQLLAARALNVQGDVAWRQGQYAEAIRLCQESLTISRALNDVASLSRALNRIGIVSFEQGDNAAAKANLEESLSFARAGHNLPNEATALNNLGLIAFAQGDYTSANTYFEQTLELARISGERRKIAIALLNMGAAAGEQGDYATAIRNFEGTLEMCRAIGEMRGVGLALKNLGGIAEYQRDFAAAKRYYQQSLELSVASGERQSIAATQVKLGHVARQQGDVMVALDYYQDALRLAQEIDATPTVVEVVMGAAGVIFDKPTALRWLGMALAHPALFDNMRSDALAILEQVRPGLNEDQVNTLLEEGKTLELSTIVETILTL
ncbi:MAG: tetratricopeptide repeat protein [bacterium]|nr:tetratricopeptide repeat protein [bacterium]